MCRTIIDAGVEKSRRENRARQSTRTNQGRDEIEARQNKNKIRV